MDIAGKLGKEKTGGPDSSVARAGEEGVLQEPGKGRYSKAVGGPQVWRWREGRPEEKHEAGRQSPLHTSKGTTAAQTLP